MSIPPDERERRWELVRAELRQQQIDCAIILSPETQYWLCGYDTFLGALLQQALVLTADRQPPTLVVWDADVAIAQQTSTVDDIRTYRFGVDDPAAMFIETARARTPASGAIGIDLSARTTPYSFGVALTELLAGTAVADVAGSLARLRTVKSPVEIELMRRAGAYGRAGLAAARAHARAGISEIQLAAEIEYAMRRAGSDYVSIPTELSSGDRSTQVHGAPSHRLLAAGDVVHVEIGGVEQRYNCVAIQSFVVPGAPPKRAARDLYRAAVDSLRAGLRQLRPDVPAAEVEAPALDIIRTRGLGDNFKMRFGYGVGIGYPPTWLEPLQITRTSADILRRGTTFVLHACLIDESERVGVVAGGTYAITADGFELLSGAGDVDLMTS